MDDLGGADGVEFWRAEAQRWRVEATELAGYRAEAERLRADNLVLRTQVADLQAQLDALVEKVSVLAKLAFGTSSEKSKRASGGDGTAAGSCGEDTAGDPAGGRAKRGQRKGSRGHGRRDYSHLPTREEIHDVPEAERVCPRCGAGYASFGEECCEQIDWEVALTRIVHRRPRYRRTCRCPVRGVLVAAPVGKAIAKGPFTTGFMARLLCEKFVLGRPAHRIVAALAHDGLDLAEGTLAGVFAACSQLLAPLVTAISDRNAAAAHLHIDETSWNVYAAVAGKDSHRWWCWVFLGPDTTVFTIAPSRSRKVLTEHLGIDTDDKDKLPDTLPGGRRLLLSSDFYTVYQSLGRIDGVDNLWCWAHIRRYFIRAGDAHPELAAWTAGWVERIAALYVAHTALRAAAPASPEHTKAAAQLRTALNSIDAERTAQARHRDLQHPAAAKVLATLDREWDGLARHHEHPELDLDNNTSQRALRGPVIGRKNYYGSGSVISAELAGRVFTVTATAARAGLNPLAYLRAYLDECARAGGSAPTGAALTRFLPWAVSTQDRTAWAHDPRPHTHTTEPDTDADPRAGPAPENPADRDGGLDHVRCPHPPNEQHSPTRR